MKDQYKLRGTNGKFFVKGQGFVADEKGGSALDTCAADCAQKLGYVGTLVKAKLSFAVVYIRKGEGEKLLAGGAKAPANAAAGQLDPSRRRFAERDEAIHHGARFAERRKNRGDKPGTAEHEGFFVIESTDEVNSAVNWKSGLTNSITK